MSTLESPLLSSILVMNMNGPSFGKSFSLITLVTLFASRLANKINPSRMAINLMSEIL